MRWDSDSLAQRPPTVGQLDGSPRTHNKSSVSILNIRPVGRGRRLGCDAPRGDRYDNGHSGTVAVIRPDAGNGGGRQPHGGNSGLSVNTALQIFLVTTTGRTLVCRVLADDTPSVLARTHQTFTAVPLERTYFLLNGRPLIGGTALHSNHVSERRHGKGLRWDLWRNAQAASQACSDPYGQHRPGR